MAEALFRKESFSIAPVKKIEKKESNINGRLFAIGAVVGSLALAAAAYMIFKHNIIVPSANPTSTPTVDPMPTVDLTPTVDPMPTVILTANDLAAASPSNSSVNSTISTVDLISTPTVDPTLSPTSILSSFSVLTYNSSSSPADFSQSQSVLESLERLPNPCEGPCATLIGDIAANLNINVKTPVESSFDFKVIIDTVLGIPANIESRINSFFAAFLEL